MPTPYARTLAQIVTGAQKLCGDYRRGGGDGRLFSWEEYHHAVNDFLLEFCKDKELLKESAVVYLQTGVAIYELPGDCLRLLRMQADGGSGLVVFPTTLPSIDLHRLTAAEGSPIYFLRQCLAWNQFAVMPVPTESGSSYTGDSDYGLVRQVTDEGGNELTVDLNYGGLRTISGTQFVRSGRGNIVRGLISPYGNLQIDYVRSPVIMGTPDEYPDPDIPEWIHKDIPFAIASRMLRYRKDKLAQAKVTVFTAKWSGIEAKLRDRTDLAGSVGHDVRPL